MIRPKLLDQSDWLADTVRGMLPAEVAVASADPRLSYAGLHRDETPVLATMIAKRKREYIAGRVAAHEALAAIGVFARPVVAGQDRSPQWPNDTVGSISHSTTHCIAVAARKGAIRSLGIDVEPQAELDSNVVAEVCTNDEINWLSRYPIGERGDLTRVIFSAKESVFKAQYPLTGCLFGFMGLRIDLDQENSRFKATFTDQFGEFHKGELVFGRVFCGHGLVLTTCVL
ncbi:MAG: 4'-phosphopantetheinyl transferase superfamily protein [Rhodobacteraceae bacterium]|nr:4'-phosphopantetheinyl transferase superfamily protein [Paracoccaceae bacterium]